MTGPCFATFRSRGPQPPAAEARKINRSRDCCVPRRLRPFAHNIIVGLNVCLSPTGLCSFFPAHAAGALAFLRDQEPSNAARAEAACGLCLASARKTVGQRKQRSRRECDSPLPTPVGTENRTFPGQQPLPVLRYQCKKSEVLLNLQLNTKAAARGDSDLTKGER